MCQEKKRLERKEQQRRRHGKRQQSVWNSYSEAVIEGHARRTHRVFMGDSILKKTYATLSEGEGIVVCLPGARVEHNLHTL